MTDVDFLITNIGELVTLEGPPGPRRGSGMSELGLVRGGSVAALAGRVVAAGRESEVGHAVAIAPGAIVIDAGGGVVTPGLIDPHTHPVFAATREEEFAMRVRGLDYQEIAAAGGGIRSSVRALRAESEDGLFAKASERLDRMLSFGTTTIEAKSGYGLSLDSEIIMLKVVRSLGQRHAVSVVPTFLGAHEVPDEWRDDRDGYVAHVVDEMIPAVAAGRLARFCDVFCEQGVFTVEQSERILREAKRYGMRPKIHADELSPSGGAELAARVGAISADHLVCVSDRGVSALARASVVAVLLPGTTLSLGKTDYAPARKMIDSGVPVALATDLNPGSSMTESMQIIMALGSMMLRMTPEEVIVASTTNAAAAVGMDGEVGTLAAGKRCDLVLWEVDDYRAIPYHYGVNLAEAVVKSGRVVWSRAGDALLGGSLPGGSRPEMRAEE